MYTYYLSVAARIILGLLFLASGLLKLPDLKGFYVTVLKYGMLKGRLARVFAYAFPFVELVVGSMAVISFRLRIASGLMLLLLFASTSGVIFAILQKKDIDNCGCYGTSIKVKLDWKKVLENMVWIAIAAFFFIYQLLH